MPTSSRCTRRRALWPAASAASPSGIRFAPGTRTPTVWPTSRSTARTGVGSRDAVSIRDDLQSVEQRIAEACARTGRKREEVTLVAVSKTKPASMIEEAIAAGVTEVGENRVQEARDKKPLVHGAARWHLIGHLQSNKAKDAVRLFDVIQTIDSADLAEKVARAAASAGKVQDVLIEVNIGNEPQKSGAAAADVSTLADRK